MFGDLVWANLENFRFIPYHFCGHLLHNIQMTEGFSSAEMTNMLLISVISAELKSSMITGIRSVSIDWSLLSSTEKRLLITMGFSKNIFKEEEDDYFVFVMHLRLEFVDASNHPLGGNRGPYLYWWGVINEYFKNSRKFYKKFWQEWFIHSFNLR